MCVLQYLYVIYPPVHQYGDVMLLPFFSHLVSQLYLQVEFDHIIFNGDFNARIIEGVDGVVPRVNINNSRNDHCDSFLKFLKKTLYIINGHVTPDKNNYTCVSSRGGVRS